MQAMAIGNFSLMGNAIRLFNIEMETVKLSDIGPKQTEPTSVTAVTEKSPPAPEAEPPSAASPCNALATNKSEDEIPCQEFLYPPNDMSQCK